LSTTRQVPLWKQVLIVLVMLGLVWGLGRYAVPIVLERLARERNREGFLFMVMLAVFLPAWAMHQAGLSMALGGFMMGMLLSGTRYSLQVQALIPLGLMFRVTRREIVRLALLLAQSGELGFVLFGSAKALGIIDEATFVLMVGMISLSMLATPILMRLDDLVGEHMDRTARQHPFAESDPPDAPKVLIGGYGRVGHSVAILLHTSGIPVMVFDTDPARVAQGEADGLPVHFGDLSDPALLAKVHLERTALVVLTIDHSATALRIVSHLRDLNPEVPVIARARDLQACGQLVQAGATQAYPEVIESSLRLAGEALQMVGAPSENIDLLLQGARERNYAMVRQPK
jgi:glutathione-regulated potassium-efflux system ancillary protein KefC